MRVYTLRLSNKRRDGRSFRTYIEPLQISARQGKTSSRSNIAHTSHTHDRIAIMRADLRESPVVNTLDRAIGQQDSSGTGALEDVHECKGDGLELELHDPTAVPAPTMSMVRMYFLAFSMMLTWFLGVSEDASFSTDTS